MKAAFLHLAQALGALLLFAYLFAVLGLLAHP